MLHKTNRIRKKKDFDVVFKTAQRSAKSFKSNLFVFKTAKNDLGVNRFGFVVSQKVSKKAVIRNKIKRQLSEAVRPEIEKIKTGTDVVFIALPGIDKKEFSEIKKAVSESLKCLNP